MILLKAFFIISANERWKIPCKLEGSFEFRENLIKENISFWEENIDSDAKEILDYINDLFDDARQVATTISGYVAKRLIKRSSCDLCK